MLRLPLLAALAVLVGCDGDGLAPKTYPSAGDFPEITVVSVLEAAASPDGVEPGRYNVRAYVVEVNACPEGAACFAPDSITLADGPETDPGPPALTFGPDEVRQFREGARYLFSVEVTRPDPGPPFTVRLLGYDRAGA